MIQSRPGPEAATLIGQGKVQELAAEAASIHADVVIFDHDLTPTQQRNLEKAIGTRVIDRTQLILDIFASRARTREGPDAGRVGAAQLSFAAADRTRQGDVAPWGVELEPVVRAKHNSKPTAAASRSASKRSRTNWRAYAPARACTAAPQRGPDGHAGAGGLYECGQIDAVQPADAGRRGSRSRMFATLDPTVRPLTLPSRRRVLLSDTVGFIRNLPPRW